MVAALLTLLIAGVLQLALALHVRNTMISAAAEGARVAALADQTPQAGVDRTEQLLADALGGYAANVSADVVTVDGAPVVVMTVEAPAPEFGLWGFGTIRVDGRAFVEGPRD